MNSGRQQTLFQTWGVSGSRFGNHAGGANKADKVGNTKSSAIQPEKFERAGKVLGAGDSSDRRPAGVKQLGGSNPACLEAGFADGEDDDDVLLVAVYEAEKSLTLDTVAKDKASLFTVHQQPETSKAAPQAFTYLPGFDVSSGDVWIYPTNHPIRDYQFKITETALFKNTLVSLPTGMGKTFIAAVLMYNFYRWYPSGKIIFMAPTKPLVAQQIEACYKVMGIPQEHMAEMTGNTQAASRKAIWKSKRVFFLTPQVMVNDLSRGAVPAASVKCLVVDEAHKALGNHAYCQVIKELSNYTQQFRILALSATPGSDTKAVQQVLSNLLIAHIELRSEDSPDIQFYSHQRRVEKFVVPLGEELTAVRNSYIQVLETFTGRLTQLNVLSRKDIPNLTKYQIILARDQFRKNPPSHVMGVQQGMMEGDFALCISLYHGYELLQQMGLRSLYIFLQGIMDGTKGMMRAKNELSRNSTFMELYQQLETLFVESVKRSRSHVLDTNGDQDRTFIYSHPKLKKLEEVVVEHFQSWGRCNGQNTLEGKSSSLDTRIMIFSSFRDSVREIAEMLSRHQPLVRVMTFVGHSSGKSTKGFTQREQLEVVRRFREGGYNSLVSTCVGEEGLDIGEVDMIICFDAQKSPIRLVQRMGRTGRKRHGRIVVILAEGREERNYNQSQCNKRSIYKTMSSKTFHMYQNSPRMIPDGINPQVHKMYIFSGEYESKENSKCSKGRRSSSILMESKGLVIRHTSFREDGLLTPEAAEIWNTAYRLTANDGVEEPKLPRVHFETLKNEEDIVENNRTGIRELSLSEWRIWQNQPFPTHLVDHSDRCQHFISIMDMMELMKQEENSCSYALEMMSYLQMEDVLKTTCNEHSNSFVHSSGKSHNHMLHSKFKKKNHKHTSMLELQMFELNAFDDEDASLSRQRKSKTMEPASREHDERPKSQQTEGLHFKGYKESHSLDSNVVTAKTSPPFNCCNNNSGPNEEMELNVHFDMGEFVYSGEHDADNDVNEIPLASNLTAAISNIRQVGYERSNLSMMTEQNKHCIAHVDELRNENKSLNQTFTPADGSCNLNSDPIFINSTLSSIFYIPATKNNGAILTPSVDDVLQDMPFSINAVLVNAKTFLMKSPPPISTLSVIEEPGMSNKDKSQHSDLFQLHLSITQVLETKDKCEELTDACTLVSLSQERKAVVLETPKKLSVPVEDCVLQNHGTVKAFSPSWDAMFDGSSEEDAQEYTKEQAANCQNVPVKPLGNEQAHTNMQKESRIKNSVNILLTDNDESINLFGDDQQFLDITTGNASDCKSTKNDSIIDGPLEQETNIHLSDHFQSSATYNKNILAREGEPANIGKLQEISEYSEKSGSSKSYDLYNYSSELFSVNFDLGFSIPESDNELSERNVEIFDKSDCEPGGFLNSDLVEKKGTSKLNSFFPVQQMYKERDTPKEDLNFIGNNCSSPVVKKSPSGNSGTIFRTLDLPFSPLLSTEAKKCTSPPLSTPTSLFTPRKDGHCSNRVHKTITVDSFSRGRLEISKSRALNHTKFSLGSLKRTLSKSAVFDNSGIYSKQNLDNNKLNVSNPSPKKEECGTDSEEEHLYRRRHKKVKTNVLESPEMENSDFDSPVLGVRKKKCLFKLSGFSDSENEVFQKKLIRFSEKDSWSSSKKLSEVANVMKGSYRSTRKQVQQFLDEEAELSSEGAEDVSSDEGDEDENENDNSLTEFLDDNTQLSQGINDSDMHGVYLKSVRSPDACYRYKMISKRGNDMTIFSQIPEQDETYMEDSFCVQGDQEETDTGNNIGSNEDETVNYNLLIEDTFIDGRKQYHTRRRKRLKQSEIESTYQELPKKKKGSRIITYDDSSDEEISAKVKKGYTNKLCSKSRMQEQHQEGAFKKSLTVNHSVIYKETPEGKVHATNQRYQMQLNMKASMSETLDFQPQSRSGRVPASQAFGDADTLQEHKKCQSKPHLQKLHRDSILTAESSFLNLHASTSSGQQSNTHLKTSVLDCSSFGFQEPTMPLCVLVDSREISSGPEVLSYLKIQYGIKAEVCSLNGCDYIVSNRMAVERKLLSEFANSMNKNKLVESIHHLKGMFERICIIVEKDRIKLGDASRICQRTKYYDSILSALITAGIRILFSSSQKDTAGLLAELIQVEHRKDASIKVPLEAQGLKQQILQFYLSIPDISYITALNLCHRFTSISQMVNSSVEKISACAQISYHKAEKIYRYIHFIFDSDLMPKSLTSNSKNKAC
ncbi:Fanconi anemia group M protein [Latimeria chalumnae]|uniref:Fanconi anemia group M protein n=1 Tax=Latimeria chalumnae TaxID=7897 RepID=UPI00313C6D42